MACPTCDHTMERTDQSPDGPGVFWCPRCGTIKTEHGIDAPWLIGRVRDLFNQPHALPYLVVKAAYRMGIIESVYLPAEREQVIKEQGGV